MYYKMLIITAMVFSTIAVSAQENQEEVNYERSSLHIMMIKHLNQKYDETIEQVFKSSPFPDRFNDHNLGVKSVAFAETSTDISTHIDEFCKKVNLGQKMVAKWFDRDKATGSFDMDLVKERGFYNASQADVNLARASMRGEALLMDAGENLINNTYLIVNDIEYKSKGTIGAFFKAMAAVYTYNAKAVSNQLTNIGGFRVSVKSYLFKLVWNDDIATEFYAKYYTEDGTADKDKVEGFKNEKQLFCMEYMGRTESESSEQHFSKSKDPASLLTKVLTRALDKNIAQLQHAYAPFRIKAPLISTEPLQAYIGLKEDVKENSVYEVLERVQNEDGSITYNAVGTVRPAKGKIWDNRYMSYEDDDVDKSIKATVFEKVSGKNDFFPGMLLRELK